MLTKFSSTLVTYSRSIPTTNLSLISNRLGVRFAGHSHWKNIQHTKAASDLKKNRLYNKMLGKIRYVLYETGSNFNMAENYKLAAAFEEAKNASVPLTTINGFLDKMKQRKLNLQSVVYEYRGPLGLLVVITALTDNKNKTRNEINYILKKYNVKISEGALQSFEYKGYVYWKPPEDVTNPDEKALDDAIEVGAEEVCRDEDDPQQLKFICDGKILNAVKTKLQGRNYEINNAEEVYIPFQSIQIEENMVKALSDAFGKVESEVSEVQAIFSNIA